MAKKKEKLPAFEYLEMLHIRNEWLLQSEKPLRLSLQGDTGDTEKIRKDFLQQTHKRVHAFTVVDTWNVQPKGPKLF